MRQVDAGLLSQSGLVGVEGDLIDAGAVAHVIEVHVAGLLNAPVQRHGAVSTLLPALVITPVKRCAAGTMHGELIVDGARFETRYRHKRLERGTRRILRLNRAIQQRVIGIIGDFPPIGRLDVHGEFVGIEAGAANHRQHLAGARIHGHDRAVLAFHG